MKKIFKLEYIINLIIILALLFLTFYKLPYEVTEPGGIENVSNSFKIDTKSHIKGSINLTYVKTSRPNLIYYWYAKLRGFEIDKIENVKEYKDDEEINRILYYSSFDNAVLVAYKAAKKDITLKNKKYYVYYNVNSKSELKPGDIILEVDGIKVLDDKIINKLINSKDGFVSVKYLRKNKEYTTDIEPIVKKNKRYLGISLIETFDYDANPHIEFLPSANTFGPSGGAMMCLAIYANLLDYDITKGLKIAGTGTISADGRIGPIGSIDYKIKSAMKSGVDIFFIPKKLNYLEYQALGIDTKDMKIVPVNSFDDIIKFLENR